MTSPGRRGAALALLLAGLAAGPVATAAARHPPEPPGHGGRTCGAFTVTYRHGRVRAITEYAPQWALEHARRLGASAVLWSWVRGSGDCRTFQRLMIDVLRASDEVVGLEQHGWHVEAVDAQRYGGVRVHEITARRGEEWIVYDRPGARPRVDPEIVRPGQVLLFPRSEKKCTAGWLLRLRGGRIVGLTAGHCSDAEHSTGPRAEAPYHLRHAHGHEIRQPLGPVLDNAGLSDDRPDALVYSLYGVPLAAQQVQQPGGAPYRVAGVLPAVRQRNGVVVCFNEWKAARPHCGRIVGRDSFILKPVVCIDRRSYRGSSGGPVYTRPRGGEVRAVGIVTRRTVFRDRMCYTPIQEILRTFRATLPLGSFGPSG